MSHVHELQACANRKFTFYGIRPELWWSNLYSKPIGEVSYLNYEYCYWYVAKICFTIYMTNEVDFWHSEVCRVCYTIPIHFL